MDTIQMEQINFGDIEDQYEIIDLINRLDDDCLAEIFMYLPTLQRIEVEKVCAKWGRASELAWHDIKKLHIKDVYEGRSVTKPLLESILLHCGRYLTHLLIHPSKILDSSIMSVIGEHCRNLTKLRITLHLDEINEEYLRQAFIEMKNLKFLKINDYWTPESGKTSGIHNLILHSLPEDIHEINLSTFSAIVPITEKYPFSLEKFTDLRCLTLEHWELDKNAIQQISNKQSLIHLSLEESVLVEGASLISNLYNLEYLNLAHATNVDGKLIISVANNCKNLKRFIIASSLNATASELRELGVCKNLERLILVNVRTVDKSSISCIVNGCDNLKHIDVASCSHLSASDLREIVICKNLEYLGLSRVKNIDRGFIRSIATRCKCLKHLNLSYCSHVSRRALKTLGNNMKNLEELIVENVEKVNDDIFTQMKKLKVLECPGCYNVSDIGIKRVIKNCPELERLNVYMTSVSPDSLVCAANETKIRTNNITLFLLADKEIVDNFDKLDNNSPFLTINPIVTHHQDP